MEGILERNVSKVCKAYGLSYKAQATASFIKDTWNIDVPVDKSQRRFDVAVYSEEKHKVWLIETITMVEVEASLKLWLGNLQN